MKEVMGAKIDAVKWCVTAIPDVALLRQLSSVFTASITIYL